MTTCPRCLFYDTQGLPVCPACAGGDWVDRIQADGYNVLRAVPGPRPEPLVRAAPLEADIQAEIVALLELHGWAVYQNTVRGVKPRGVTPGIPDLFAIRERLVWIEVKRPGKGRVSAAQAECHARLRAVGQEVIVAYGVEDVTTLCERLAA